MFTRARGHLGHQRNVATEVHRAGVYQRADTELTQLRQLVDCAGHGICAHETRGPGVHPPARIADQQMLVDEREPELRDGDGARHCLNGVHGKLS
jgi:hypothetical protein